MFVDVSGFGRLGTPVTVTTFSAPTSLPCPSRRDPYDHYPQSARPKNLLERRGHGGGTPVPGLHGACAGIGEYGQETARTHGFRVCAERDGYAELEPGL